MSFFEQISLKVRRGEGPFYGGIRKVAKGLLHSNLPLPGFLRPVYRVLYHLHFLVLYAFRWALNYFYREPAFRSRCTKVGKNLHMWLMPDVTGHVEIYIGDNVNLFGHLGIMSGRIFENPKLIIKDGADLGHNVTISVNKEVVIEEEVNIASYVRILDSDAHPRDPEQRVAGLPPPPDEVKPVRICRYAWVGQGSYIMKGVTVGQGAVIGANSVVVTDVPAYSVVMGNPARVVVKDVRTSVAQPKQPTEITV
ncbi:MAG TPA: acyltransferase [Bryobacteraceae bacterium]|nr:acyltransferase [Bryobacteraceae bacterium]